MLFYLVINLIIILFFFTLHPHLLQDVRTSWSLDWRTRVVCPWARRGSTTLTARAAFLSSSVIVSSAPITTSARDAWIIASLATTVTDITPVTKMARKSAIQDGKATIAILVSDCHLSISDIVTLLMACMCKSNVSRDPDWSVIIFFPKELRRYATSKWQWEQWPFLRKTETEKDSASLFPPF